MNLSKSSKKKVKRLIANHSPAGLAKLITKGKYKYPSHIDYINNYLIDIVEKGNQRIIVTLPPRHGKSELISKYFPLWFLGRCPDKNVILASFSKSLAVDKSRTARDMFSEFGPRFFKLQLAKGYATASEWGIQSKNGKMFATGLHGQITGKGADVFIIDDPIKDSSEAYSPVIRSKIWDWYESTAFTRLAPNASIIIVMTRWHNDDLVGRLLENDSDEWTVINLPAIAQENDILGRKPGEALWPDEWPIEKLLKIQKGMSEYWFTALYQQKPISGSFTIFNPSWFQYYERDERPEFIVKFMTMDTAFKDGEKNDYSVLAVWGVCGQGKLYLIDILRKQLLFPELLEATIAFKDLWKPTFIAIEDAASGQDLIPSLKKELRSKNSSVQIIPVPPMKKELRAHLTSPIIREGDVLFPGYSRPWREDYLDELKTFPAGNHDDQVDATTIALQMYDKRYRKRTSAIPKTLKAKMEPGVRKSRDRGNNLFSGY